MGSRKHLRQLSLEGSQEFRDIKESLLRFKFHLDIDTKGFSELVVNLGKYIYITYFV